MKYIKKYSYRKFSKSYIPLDKYQSKSLEQKIKEEEYNIFLRQTDENYLIISENTMLGFLSIKITDYVEIPCLYIFEEYRNRSLGRSVINDIIFSTRHNVKKDIKYVIANSFPESALFFLKNGFDFCKMDRKTAYKKKNIIKMYKKI